MVEKKHIPVKFNDLKAPRFRKTKFIHQVVNFDLYARWEVENRSGLTYNEFLAVWDLITKTIRNQVVNNPHGVRLPFSNGDLQSNYVEMLRRHTNSKASQELGHVVPYLDWHSNKKLGKAVWAIRHARSRNKWVSLYGFLPCRVFQNMVGEGFLNQPEVYRYARTNEYIASKINK